MILVATCRSQTVALAAGAELDDESGAAPVLFCGLLFLRAGRKRAGLRLHSPDKTQTFHVRLPGHLLGRDADVGVKNIELELIE